MIAISQRVYSSALNSWGNFLRYIRSDNISQPVSAYKYSCIIFIFVCYLIKLYFSCFLVHSQYNVIMIVYIGEDSISW
jgi:hypothetical protein